LFGSNSSGKTSVLQMLLLLKQTAESPDRAQVLNLGDDRSLIDLGTFQDVLFRHDLNNPMDVCMAWKLPQALEIADPARKSGYLFKDDAMGFSTSIEWQANGEPGLGRPIVTDMKYRFSDTTFGMTQVSDKKLEYDLKSGFKFSRAQGRKWKLPPPTKFYGFPDQVRTIKTRASFPTSSSSSKSCSRASSILDLYGSTRSASTLGQAHSPRIWAGAERGSWTRCSPPVSPE
jgi:hypothetical protein